MKAMTVSMKRLRGRAAFEKCSPGILERPASAHQNFYSGSATRVISCGPDVSAGAEAGHMMMTLSTHFIAEDLSPHR